MYANVNQQWLAPTYKHQQTHAHQMNEAASRVSIVFMCLKGNACTAYTNTRLQQTSRGADKPCCIHKYTTNRTRNQIRKHRNRKHKVTHSIKLAECCFWAPWNQWRTEVYLLIEKRSNDLALSFRTVCLISICGRNRSLFLMSQK